MGDGGSLFCSYFRSHGHLCLGLPFLAIFPIHTIYRMTMATGVVKFLTWNVRGLNDRIKRALIFRHLRKLNCDIICLQEIHLLPERLPLLNRPWLGWSYHSTYTNAARGVSILIHRRVHFKLVSVTLDKEGRFVLLNCIIFQQPFLIVGIYIPPPYSSSVVQEVLANLASHPCTPCIWLGDFNCPWDKSLDRFNAITTPRINPSPSSLHTLLAEFNITDAWRSRYPSLIQFSCSTPQHGALSRIDLMLVSTTLLPAIDSTEYLPRVASDHSPGMISIRLRNMPPKTKWRLNPFWLKILPPAPYFLSQWQSFFTDNDGSAPLGVVWDSFKAYARGVMTQAINDLKRGLAHNELRLAKEALEAELQYINDPSRSNRAEWLCRERLYNSLMSSKAQKKAFFSKQSYYEHGDKCGRLLAAIARGSTDPPVISSLESPSGAVTSDPCEILNIFCAFYQDLYSTHTEVNIIDIEAYLSSIPLPTLSAADRESLDSPITVQEILDSISSFQPAKSPGSDGLPIEFYKEYSELLAPRLLAVYLHAFHTGELPVSMREAIIVVLPKPGKNPLLCDSYRPISLLQSDIKILAKILARRLGKVILSLIHPDQTGFMPGKSTALNIRRLYMNIQATHEEVGSRVIVSLDAAKAFDSIEWDFLFTTLVEFGFGTSFIRWVRLLYSAPCSMVSTNGWLSPTFSLYRGTRQGCPLSPLLFALAVEPLAVRLRSEPNIRGFRLSPLHEKVSMYADDTLLYLSDPQNSLRAALAVITDFGQKSGLTINWSKSQIMPLDVSVPTEGAVSTPLLWSASFTYLGVQISRLVSDFEALNLTPLISFLQLKIKNWNKLYLSTAARISLVKMTLMPKILYILQHSPIFLPTQTLHRIRSLLVSFVWHGRRPRVAAKFLAAPWDGGGVSFPDVQLYYLASQLSHLARWGSEEQTRVQVLLVSPFNRRYSHPLHLLFCGNHFTGGTLRNHPVLRQALMVWHQVRRRYYTEGVDAYTPLWHCKLLPELVDLSFDITWQASGIWYLSQLCADTGIKSFPELQSEFALASSQLFSYLRVKHAFHTQFGQNGVTFKNFPIPALMLSPPPSHLMNDNSVKSRSVLLYSRYDVGNGV